MNARRKYLRILFWLFIPYFISSILSEVEWKAFASALNCIGAVVSAVCSIIVAFCCFKLSRYWEKYSYATVVGMVYVVISVVMIVNTYILGSKASVININSLLILKLIADYFEYNGHAKLIEAINVGQAKIWKRLWIWAAVFTILSILGSALVLFDVTATAGTILIAYSPYMLVVVQLMRFVYLYRTSKAFYGMDNED